MRLVLLLLCGVATVVVGLSPRFVDECYTFCCANTTCANNFQLTSCNSEYEQTRFDRMLDYMMHTNMLYEHWFSESSEQSILQGVMCGYRFCLDGEIAELEGDVWRCQRTPTQTAKHPLELRINQWTLALLSILGNGFIIFYGVSILKRQKKLEKVRTDGGIKAESLPANLEEALSGW